MEFPKIKQTAIDQEVGKIFGHDAWIVGGRNRDAFLAAKNGINIVSKDHDYLVAEHSFEEIVEKLKKAGWRADTVGASFAVIKATKHGETIDVAMPRREESTGTGHKDFKIEANPKIPVIDDMMRRDITINAIAYRITTGEIVAPPSALRDLSRAKPTLRTITSNSIIDDPLRMLRIVQFASRFDGIIAPETKTQIRENAKLMETVARERIGEELNKLALKSVKPSMGMNLLLELELLPYVDKSLANPQKLGYANSGETLAVLNLDSKGNASQGLVASVGLKQNKYHDLNVWDHQLRAMDIAAGLIREANFLGNKFENEERQRLARILVYSALLHDIGKPVTAKAANDPTYGNTFYGHESIGAPMAHSFMRDTGASEEEAKTVGALVRNHMYATQENDGQTSSNKAIRRFLRRLEEESPMDTEIAFELQYLLRQCDSKGKSTNVIWEDNDHNHLFAQAVHQEMQKVPALSTKDLAINGNDLIELFINEGWEKDGFRGNRMLGEIQRIALDRVVEEPEINNSAMLLEIAKTYAKENYENSQPQKVKTVKTR